MCCSMSKGFSLIFVTVSCKYQCLDFHCCLQEKVEEINSQLNQEYTLRRSMLLKRLDVTIQSFGWSDRAKVSLVSLLHVKNDLLSS